MNITINGKITNALPPRRGTSKAGNEWVSQDFVIESDMDDFEFEGNIVSEKNSVCISFAVEGADIAVTVSQGANFESLTGEEFNFGTASEDDLMDVMEDNEDLMELLYELY